MTAEERSNGVDEMELGCALDVTNVLRSVQPFKHVSKEFHSAYSNRRPGSQTSVTESCIETHLFLNQQMIVSHAYLHSSPQAHDDNTACSFLYDHHLDDLLALSCERGVDEHEAKDLVQELFLRVFHLGLFRVLAERPYPSRRDWLVRTLRWMILNQRRHRSRKRRGGAACVASIEALVEEGRDISDGDAPDVLHDRRWAMKVLECSLIRLRSTLKPAAWPVI